MANQWQASKGEHGKQKQKHSFFKKWENKAGSRQDRRDGGAGRAQDGLTKTETGDQWDKELKELKRKWKKAQKQKRNRQNRKRRHHKVRQIVQARIIGKSRFHIPKK